MNIKVFLILFLAMISVSTSPIIARLLVDIPAVTVSFWRMFIGGILLWLISALPMFRQEPLSNHNRIKTQFSGFLIEVNQLLNIYSKGDKSKKKNLSYRRKFYVCYWFDLFFFRYLN